MGKPKRSHLTRTNAVKLKSESGIGKNPVRLTSSLRDASSNQATPCSKVSLPPPHLAVIGDLNEKIMLLHKSQEARLHLCNATLEDNAILKREVLRLTESLAQTKQNHQKEVIKVKKASFLEGQGVIVGEMKKVVTSKEFAAEMMWGSLFDS